MTYAIQGETGDWEVVIGLEVHCQVVSKAKLFSGAATDFGAEPNTQVSFVDAAMPGMLPVVNEYCIEQAVRTGLGLKARINPTSVFERKNYFYPDLPQGYQISQFKRPIVGEGTIVLDMEDGRVREVGIERLHLEQDAGKSMHDRDPGKTLIDLNRAGVCLMEIVSKPDLRSPEEAGAYLRKLRSILRYLGTCDGNMEQGSMRCDANVSVRKPLESLRVRTEIKNLNSVKFCMRAIAHEAERQVDVYESGGEVLQETRLYDSVRGETRPMRSKEFARDYRYFPDPDLPPIAIGQEFVDEIAGSLPELPDDRKERYVAELGLKPRDAGVLVADKDVSDFFEEVARGRDPVKACNLVTGDFFAALNKEGLKLADSPVGAERLGELLDLQADGAISGKIAKRVFEIMWETGDGPAKIVADRGLEQVTDASAVESRIDALVANNPRQVEQFKSGNEKIIGWFVGQVMRETGGKANPGMVNRVLRDKLGG